MALDLNKYLEDFRRLNPRDPGTWPLLPQIVALVAIVIAIPVGGYFVDWQGQIDTLHAGRQEEVKLKQEYVIKKGQAINLDLYRQQLSEINTQFGALLKQLPNKSEMAALLVDINRAGLGRGLQFDLFKPAPHEIMKEFYAELPIQIRVTGSYNDMGAFAGDVGELPRIVTLNNVSIEANKDGELVMNATARTFRYLDQQEIAEQQRAARRRHRR